MQKYVFFPIHIQTIKKKTKNRIFCNIEFANKEISINFAQLNYE